ncbi:MAG: aspartyl protease family protein [Marinifilaceae bacterium]
MKKNRERGYFVHKCVPIEIVTLEDNSYHVLVNVQLDGESGAMIIDTGASVSVVDRRIITELEKKKIDMPLQSRTINGAIEDIAIVRIDDFVIGKEIVGRVRMAAINLESVNEMYQRQLQRTVVGLLGSDFLYKNGAVIDYHLKTLTWRARRY